MGNCSGHPGGELEGEEFRLLGDLLWEKMEELRALLWEAMLEMEPLERHVGGGEWVRDSVCC